MKTKLSDHASLIIDRFFEINNNPDKMRGLKRAITLYCDKNGAARGSRESIAIKAAIKAHITRRGGNPSSLG